MGNGYRRLRQRETDLHGLCGDAIHESALPGLPKRVEFRLQTCPKTSPTGRSIDMSDLIRRAQQSRLLIHDPRLPKWQRVLQGLQAYSGLELTGMDEDVRGALETNLVDVNRVLGRYPLETDEDYQKISPEDLQQLLDILDETALEAIAGELDRIVAELDAGVEKLPVKAIREAREHRDLMIPRLIEAIQDAISAALAGDAPEGNAHFFAIFLLTEFRAEEAFPVILEAFSLPGELPFDLFEDAVTSTLMRILALFAGDRPEVIDALVGDRALNEYVRWEAAQCYLYLVRDGRLHRDEAVRRLQQQLRRAIDENDSSASSFLVFELMSFAPKEAMEDIAEAYRRNMVDRSLLEFEYVERSIAEGENWVRSRLERCPATGIADTIEELRRWAAFQEKPARPPAPPLPPVLPAPRLPDILIGGH